MKRSITIILALVALAIILVYLFYNHNRYLMVTIASGVAYKMDKNTGKVWVMVFDKEYPIKTLKENNQTNVKTSGSSNSQETIDPSDVIIDKQSESKNSENTPKSKGRFVVEDQ